MDLRCKNVVFTTIRVLVQMKSFVGLKLIRRTFLHKYSKKKICLNTYKHHEFYHEILPDEKNYTSIPSLYFINWCYFFGLSTGSEHWVRFYY